MKQKIEKNIVKNENETENEDNDDSKNNVKKFVCKDCNKNFANHSNIRRHYRLNRCTFQKLNLVIEKY